MPRAIYLAAMTKWSSHGALPANHITNNLFAPVMFHPVPHFFVGFGPFLDADLSGDNKATLFGRRLRLSGGSSCSQCGSKGLHAAAFVDACRLSAHVLKGVTQHDSR